MLTADVTASSRPRNPGEAGLLLRSNGRWHKVSCADILYLEAEHVYTRIVFDSGKTILQRGSLSSILSELPDCTFLRTHRSYAVNLKRVDSWDQQNVYMCGNTVPISRGMRRQVHERLRKGR